MEADRPVYSVRGNVITEEWRAAAILSLRKITQPEHDPHSFHRGYTPEGYGFVSLHLDHDHLQSPHATATQIDAARRAGLAFTTYFPEWMIDEMRERESALFQEAKANPLLYFNPLQMMHGRPRPERTVRKRAGDGILSLD